MLDPSATIWLFCLQLLPDSTAVTYEYLSTGDFHDDDASRATRVKVGSTVVASYQYLGASQLVGTEYDEIDVYSRRFDISDDYSAKLDRFNRPIEDTWSKHFGGLPGTTRKYFENDIAWDRNSNITAVDDQVFPDQFVSYALDDLNRLTDEQRRSASGGGGSLRFRNERTLSQMSNTTNDKLDLNGDTDQADTGEWNEGRGYNEVNELLGRDYDSGSFGYEDTLVYSGRGEMTDDGKNNLLDYDYWGRPRKIKNKSNVVASEYRYNGLGWRISYSDESTSHTYHLVYDDSWRNIATYRDSDSDPKERMVYDNAGMMGYGGASYIDSIVLRDKDANTAWTSASDGTLEERLYLLQNWRSDVVFVLEATGSGNGEQVENVRYEAYGTPTALPAGDTDRDGDTDATDVTQIDTWISGTTWAARGDLDLDNDVDAADKTLANGMSSANGGRGILSDRGNRKGYAGYEGDLYAVHDSWNVRYRVLDTEMGRWTRRDPIGYTDNPSLYTYVVSNPVLRVDPSGCKSAPDRFSRPHRRSPLPQAPETDPDPGTLPWLPPYLNRTGCATKCLEHINSPPVFQACMWGCLAGCGRCGEFDTQTERDACKSACTSPPPTPVRSCDGPGEPCADPSILEGGACANGAKDRGWAFEESCAACCWAQAKCTECLSGGDMQQWQTQCYRRQRCADKPSRLEGPFLIPMDEDPNPFPAFTDPDPYPYIPRDQMNYVNIK